MFTSDAQRADPGRSPLDRVFAGFEVVPAPFRAQFLAAPEDPEEVVLVGSMDEITYPRLLRPLYAALGRVGMLVPRRGRGVPTTLHVVPRRLADGTPVHEWNRTFAFEPPVRFDTTIVWDERHHDLADLVGRPRMLRMVWQARFTPPVTFTLRSIANGVLVRGRVVWLPGWLWRFALGSVEFTQIADPSGSNRVSVDLRVKHPLFGTVFRYHGSFVATVRAKAASG